VTWTGIAACWAIVDSCSPLLAGRQSVGAASVTGIDNFLDAAAIHPERDCATPITPVEIDGATQVWESSPRYAPFRAPAFPSPGPCRSRCRALASLARVRTSDDIRPRALCTPPPKSFARTPDLCTQPILPRATTCGQHRFAPWCTSAPIVTFAPQHTCALCGSALYSSRRSPAGFRVISKQDRSCWPVKRPRHRRQTNATPRHAMLADGRTVIGHENWRRHQSYATLE
jgi:hypothetical protein